MRLIKTIPPRKTAPLNARVQALLRNGTGKQPHIRMTAILTSPNYCPNTSCKARSLRLAGREGFALTSLTSKKAGNLPIRSWARHCLSFHPTQVSQASYPPTPRGLHGPSEIRWPSIKYWTRFPPNLPRVPELSACH